MNQLNKDQLQEWHRYRYISPITGMPGLGVVMVEEIAGKRRYYYESWVNGAVDEVSPCPLTKFVEDSLEVRIMVHNFHYPECSNISHVDESQTNPTAEGTHLEGSGGGAEEGRHTGGQDSSLDQVHKI